MVTLHMVVFHARMVRGLVMVVTAGLLKKVADFAPLGRILALVGGVAQKSGCSGDPGVQIFARCEVDPDPRPRQL